MLKHERYKKYRKIWIELNYKILDVYLKQDIILRSAKIIGLETKKNTVTFDTEDESSILMDFIINDYRVNGKNMVERYQEEVGSTDKMEKEILDALAGSYTSLFKVIYTVQGSASIYLYDILNERSDLVIMDINLSKTIKVNTLLFCRYVSLPFFNCTSGIGFSFSRVTDKDLLNKYKQLQIKIKADNDAMRRFGAFFRLNRIYGNEVRYKDA